MHAASRRTTFVARTEEEVCLFVLFPLSTCILPSRAGVRLGRCIAYHFGFLSLFLLVSSLAINVFGHP